MAPAQPNPQGRNPHAKSDNTGEKPKPNRRPAYGQPDPDANTRRLPPSEITPRLAKYVEDGKKLRAMTYRQVAEGAGLTADQLLDLRNGKRRWTIEDILGIADLFNTTISAILARSGIDQPKVSLQSVLEAVERAAELDNAAKLAVLAAYDGQVELTRIRRAEATKKRPGGKRSRFNEA